MDRTKVRVPDRFSDHPIFNELICGTNFGFMARRGYYLQEEVKKQPELMAKSGGSGVIAGGNGGFHVFFELT